jgi:putative ABC transport system permease protein
MLATLSTDLRIACRTVLRTRGFAGAAIVTLGLGMTLSVSVLIVMNAYLFRTLPYPGATRLYSVRYAAPGQQPPDKLEALNWASLGDVIEDPIAWDLDMFYLIGDDQAMRAPGAWVTPGFVRGLGIQPAIGRGFGPDAFLPNSPNVAVISHRLWQSRYAGDPNVVGRRFEAYVSDRPDEAETFTIIGVMPSGFWHLNDYTDVLAPLRAQTYPYLVRLRDGVSPTVAAERISSLVRSGAVVRDGGWQVELVSTHEAYVARLRPVLRAVAVAAGLVLLVTWANVAGLLLIRSTERRKEIAVRMALGAGRGSIARLLTVEALLLGAGATSLGLLVAGLALPWLAPLIQRELGRTAPGGAASFSIDASVVILASLCGLMTALICGLAPLAASWRVSLMGGLRAGGRSATEGRGSQRTRSILIALEVAASLVLLAGSTLMIQSVIRLLRVDLGIRPDRVLSVPVALRQRTYPDEPTRLEFFERALSRVGGIPGVEAVALGNWWPLQPPQPQRIDADRSGNLTTLRGGVMAVSGEYFRTLSVSLVAGRPFSPADRLGSEPVAIVSETLARRVSGGNAVGERVRVVPENDDDPGESVFRRVVGIARDVRQAPTDEDLADLYLPVLQTPRRFGWVYVRTAGSPVSWLPQIRSVFREIDPEVSLNTAAPLQAAIDEQLSRPKFLAWLLAGFAVVSALLALVGIYGVIAYALRQREREIAVRMAVGADSRRIVGLFLRQGGSVLLAGLAIGVLGAAGAGRALESQLFGVRPTEPMTLAMTALAFAFAGCIAIWWPASRAAATDPAAALKDE